MSGDLHCWIQDLESADWRVAFAAEEALVAAGEQAARALAAEILGTDREPSAAFLYPFARIGVAAVPALASIVERGAPRQVVRAVECLGLIRCPEAAQHLQRLLGHADAAAAEAAAEGLVAAGLISVSLLAERARQGTQEGRAIALRSLARIGNPACLEVIAEALQAREPTLRLVAVQLLAGRTERGYALRVSQAVLDPDPRVREAAAAAVMAHGNAELIQKLQNRISVQEEAVRARCALAFSPYLADSAAAELILAVAPPDTLARLLLERLKGPADARARAVVLLSRATEPPFTELIDLLGYRNAAVRGAAVEILSVFGEAALPWLARAQGGRSSTEWHMTLKVLERIGPPAVEWLCEVSLNTGGSRQEGAVRTLGRIGAPEAIPTLVHLIERGDWLVPPARALADLARKGRWRALNAAVPVLRRQMAVWRFPSAEEQQACQEALYAIEAATRLLADLPLPAEGKAGIPAQLPIPAEGFPAEPE